MSGPADETGDANYERLAFGRDIQQDHKFDGHPVDCGCEVFGGEASFESGCGGGDGDAFEVTEEILSGLSEETGAVICDGGGEAEGHTGSFAFLQPLICGLGSCEAVQESCGPFVGISAELSGEQSSGALEAGGESAA